MTGSFELCYESFEEKLYRMDLDKFKKNYPIFKYIETIISVVKSNVKIYNNDIMKKIEI